MFDNVRVDLARARRTRARAPEVGGGDRSATISNLRMLLAVTTWSVVAYRYAHWVSKNVSMPVVRPLLQVSALLFQHGAGLFTGVYIHPEAEIGPGLVVHTPYGICVGPTRIGANCTVDSGVLINGGVRKIGDDVYFGPGAKVIGPCNIGNHVVVVANSLILTDIPDNRTVVGVPARIRLPGGKPQRFETPAQAEAPEAAAAGL